MQFSTGATRLVTRVKKEPCKIPKKCKNSPQLDRWEER